MSGSITSSTIRCGLNDADGGDRVGAVAGRLDLEVLEAERHRDDVDDVRLVVDDEDSVGLAHARSIDTDPQSFLRTR